MYKRQRDVGAGQQLGQPQRHVDAGRDAGRGDDLAACDDPLGNRARAQLTEQLGRSLIAQIVTVGIGVSAGIVAYAVAVWALRVPEADQVLRLIRARRG